VELASTILKVRLIEGVDLSLRRHFLVKGQVVAGRHLSFLELNQSNFTSSRAKP